MVELQLPEVLSVLNSFLISSFRRHHELVDLAQQCLEARDSEDPSSLYRKACQLADNLADLANINDNTFFASSEQFLRLSVSLSQRLRRPRSLILSIGELAAHPEMTGPASIAELLDQLISALRYEIGVKSHNPSHCTPSSSLLPRSQKIWKTVGPVLTKRLPLLYPSADFPVLEVQDVSIPSNQKPILPFPMPFQLDDHVGRQAQKLGSYNGMFGPTMDLAVYLQSYSYALHRERQYHKSVTAMTEALCIYRKAKVKSKPKSLDQQTLAFHDARALVDHMAGSLELCADSFRALGQDQEAYDCIREAAAWRREINQQNAELENLVRLFDEAAVVLYNAGRHEAAATTWGCVIRLANTFATQPFPYPDLTIRRAQCTRNLACALHCTSQLIESYQAFETAISLWRQCVDDLHTWGTPIKWKENAALAECLNDYAYSLCVANDLTKAADVMRETVKVSQELVGLYGEENSRSRWNHSCFLRNLAWCLRGHDDGIEEAVKTTEEALTIVNELHLVASSFVSPHSIIKEHTEELQRRLHQCKTSPSINPLQVVPFFHTHLITLQEPVLTKIQELEEIEMADIEMDDVEMMDGEAADI